jgi:hypothetical protein
MTLRVVLKSASSEAAAPPVLCPFMPPLPSRLSPSKPLAAACISRYDSNTLSAPPRGRILPL